MALNFQNVAFNISANVSGQQSVDKFSSSLQQLGQQGQMSARQINNAMRMVPAQLTDIATQLAGGQSPFLIMMQQGGQLRDMFGSVSGALAGVGRTVAGILTPINVVAAAFGAVAFAAFKGYEQTSELERQLLLTGSAAGKTAGQIEEMAVKLRATTAATAGAARDMATQVAASGAFGPDTIEQATQAMLRLQKLSGQTADDIVKDFAGMATGVAQWAATHNRSYNYLTLDQFKYIKQLEAMGQQEKAIRENVRLLDAALAERKENLGTLEKAWRSLKETASSAWDAMLAVGRSSPEKDLANLKKEIADLEEAVNRNRANPRDPERQRAAEAELFAKRVQLQAMQSAVDRAQTEADTKARKAAKEQQGIQDEASGVAAGLRGAAYQQKLAQLEAQSNEELRMIRRQVADLDFEYANGLMSETEYTNRKIALRRREMSEKALLAQKEIEEEQKRKPSDRVDAANQQVKLTQMRTKLAELSGQASLEEASATGQAARAYKQQTEVLEEQAAAQGRSNVEVQIAAARQQALNQGLARTPELFAKLTSEREAALRKLNDRTERKAVEDFNTGIQDQIRQLQLEREAAGMSALEHRIRAAALKIDADAQQKSKDMTQQGKDAMLEAAEAAKRQMEAQLRLNDAQSRLFGTGAQDAFKTYIDSATNAAEGAKTLFTNAFQGMEDALVNFVKTGKLDFKSLADSLIADMARIAIRQKILGPLLNMAMNMFGPSVGTVGTTPGGTPLIGDFPVPVAMAANGGIIGQNGHLPLSKYASGGIANRPQLALFGEGRMPEAFVPLPDGRRIPVNMQGGGGGANVTVNVVNNAASTQATAKERQDSNGNRIIDVMIEQVKASIAADIARGTGTVTSALERTYGANRAAGAY